MIARSVSIAALLVAAGLPGAGRAAEPVSAARLTLPEALDAALAHFPTVRGSRARSLEADRAVGEERAAAWPLIQLAGSATRYEEPALVYPIHDFDPVAFPPFDEVIFQGGASVSWTLFDGGGRRGRVRSAERHAEASRASVRASEGELLARVATQFLEVLTSRHLVAAHDRRLDALRRERDRVLAFLVAGKAARVDSLRVEAALAAAESDRVSRAARLDIAERDLTGLTGLPRERTRAANLAPFALADTALDARDALVERGLERSPAVGEASAEAAAASASARAARGARFPRLEVVGAWQAWSDDEGNGTDEWNAGVRLTQILFTGGAVSGRIARADAGAAAADEARRLARIQTGRAVHAAYARVREAEARAAGLSAAEAQWAEVARIEALALAAGSGTQTALLDAEADLLEARVHLVEARQMILVARLELARLTGDLDAAWLHAHLETLP